MGAVLGGEKRRGSSLLTQILGSAAGHKNDKMSNKTASRATGGVSFYFTERWRGEEIEVTPLAA